MLTCASILPFVDIAHTLQQILIKARGSVLKDALNVAMLSVLDNQDWVDKTAAAHFGDGTGPDARDEAEFPSSLLASTISVVVLFAISQFCPSTLENRHPDKIRRKSSQLAIFAAADSDGNGTLSMEEAEEQGMSEATFRAIDANGDGELTVEEFTGWQEKEDNRRGPKRGVRLQAFPQPEAAIIKVAEAAVQGARAPDLELRYQLRHVEFV